MLKYDWEKQLEIALSIPQNIKIIDTGNDLEIVGFRDDDDKQRQLIVTWFMCAKDCWPAVLRERAKLEVRVRELELENERLRGEIAGVMYDIDLKIAGCCGMFAGKRFCESYGCSTLLEFREALERILREDVKDDRA